MKLRRMEFGGFRTFAAPTTFTFGHEPGLYFLEGGENQVDPSLGSNGVGKSTVWSALCWILFGKTADGLKAGDLKSWQSKDKGYYGKLEIGKHVVRRTWKPNKLTFDGEVVEQKRLEELLGLHFDTFVSSVVLAQGGEMFLDLTAAKKLSLFTSILGLDKWIDYSSMAKARAHTLEQDIHTLEVSISKIEGTLDGLHIEEVQEKRDKWYHQHSDAIKRIRREARDLDHSRGLLSKVLAKSNRSVRSLKKKLKAQRAVVLEAEQEYEEAKVAFQTILGKSKSCASRIAEEEEHLEDVKKGKGVCRQCGQKVNRGRLRTHIQHLEEALDKRRSTFEELAVALGRKEQHRKDTHSHLETEKQISGDLKRKLEKAKEVQAERQQDFALTDSAIKSKEVRAKEQEKEKNPFTKMVRNLKEEQEKLENRLKAKERRHGTLQARHASVSYWISGFREVRLYLIEEALAQLELETNKALTDLGFGTDWRIQYAIDKRTKKGSTVTGFTVTVKSPQTDTDVPFQAWSGGEKQRLKIAGSIGFIALVQSRTGMDLGIEVYDEPTQHLSPEGIDSLLETLRQRALETGKRIWLVDHHTLDYGDFAGRTVVQKTKEGSTIEERR